MLNRSFGTQVKGNRPKQSWVFVGGGGVGGGGTSVFPEFKTIGLR